MADASELPELVAGYAIAEEVPPDERAGRLSELRRLLDPAGTNAELATWIEHERQRDAVHAA